MCTGLRVAMSIKLKSFEQAIILSLTYTAIIMVLDTYKSLPIALASIAILTALERRTLKIFAYVATASLIYTALAIAMQILVIGSADIASLTINAIRFTAIAVTSTAIAMKIDVPEATKRMFRKCPVAATALLYTLKTVRIASMIWRDVEEIYRVNLGRTNIFTRMRIAVEAYIFTLIHYALQSTEAIATRASKLLARDTHKNNSCSV